MEEALRKIIEEKYNQLEHTSEEKSAKPEPAPPKKDVISKPQSNSTTNKQLPKP